MLTGAVLGIMTGMIDADSFKDSEPRPLGLHLCSSLISLFILLGDFDLFLYGLEPGQVSLAGVRDGAAS